MKWQLHISVSNNLGYTFSHTIDVSGIILSFDTVRDDDNKLWYTSGHLIPTTASYN